MEFGILFTSHANEDIEPYPRRDVHARVTREIVRRRPARLRLCLARRASLLGRIRHHAGRVRLCRLHRGADQADQDRHRGGDAAARQSGAGGREHGLCRHPERRALRAGPGLRLPQIRVRRLRHRFRGAARHPGGGDPAAARPVQEEARRPHGQAFPVSRSTAPTRCSRTRCRSRIRRSSWPAPPTARSRSRRAWASVSCCRPGRRSTALARQIAHYRAELAQTPAELRKNPACGHVDVARYVYVAETDAKRAAGERSRSSCATCKHFSSGHTSGLSRNGERRAQRLRGLVARRDPARLARDT